MSASDRNEELHRKAVEFVRAAYDMADQMRKVDLDALNESRPPTLRYRAQHELVREFMARANAMLDFAGHLGLIESEEDAEIGRSIGRDHPDLVEWLEDEDKRLSGER